MNMSEADVDKDMRELLIDPPSTVSVIRQKGADITNESSRKRRHDVARAGQTVHKKCRLQYNKDKDIQKMFESCVWVSTCSEEEKRAG